MVFGDTFEIKYKLKVNTQYLILN